MRTNDNQHTPDWDKVPTDVFEFPVPIKQIGPRSIVVEVTKVDYPVFSKQQEEEVVKILGIRDGTNFLDEQANKLQRELLIRSIR